MKDIWCMVLLDWSCKSGRNEWGFVLLGEHLITWLFHVPQSSISLNALALTHWSRFCKVCVRKLDNGMNLILLEKVIISNNGWIWNNVKRIMDKPKESWRSWIQNGWKLLKIGFIRGTWKRWTPRKLRQLGPYAWIQEIWEKWNLRRLNPRKFRDMDFQRFIQKLEMCWR